MMKITCPTHGAHFQDEIEDLVKCRWYWKVNNATTMPRDLKKQIVKFLFSWDIDLVFKEYGWIIGVGFRADKSTKVWNEDFEKLAPGYSDWPDAKRRNFQRKLIKKQLNREKKDGRN